MTNNKKILLLLAIATTLSSIYAAGPQRPVPTVMAEKVSKKLDNPTHRYIGYSEAEMSVTLPVRISGTLEKRNFKEGDTVKKGQLLFEIEDTTYKAKVAEAKALLEMSQVELDFAEKDFKRQEDLYKKKAVSQLVFDNAKRLYASQKAKIAEIKAILMDVENTLSYTKIYAPIDGKIGKVIFSVGNYVTPASEPLTDIVDSSVIEVRFSISERDFIDLFGSAKNMKNTAIVELEMANGKKYPYEGKVFLVSNKVDSNTGTLTVWAKFKNPNDELNSGGYVTVLLSRNNSKEQTVISRTGVLFDKTGSYVLVVDKDGIIQRRNVKIGEINNRYQTIESGLKVGETVVIGGTHKIMPKMKVNLKFEEVQDKVEK